MPKNRFTKEIKAPQKKVWEIMTDHERYVKWSPAKKLTYDQTGSPEKQGMGAIRVFHLGPGGRLKTREEVIGWDPPVSMTYRILNQWPMKDYVSTMSLSSEKKGSVEITKLVWESEWENRIPEWAGGKMVFRTIRKALDGFAEGIKQDAERTPHSLLNPESVSPAAANYSLGVLNKSNQNQLITSGIVPALPDGSVPKKIGEQTMVIWASIQELLHSAEMSVTDIVSITTYVVNKEARNLQTVMDIRDQNMAGHLPASTLLVVPRLADKRWKVEISIIASH